MEAQFVDTNIFLRHLTNDHPEKAKACFELFKKAARDEVSLVTADWVIAEIIYVMSGKKTYNLPPEEIKNRLKPILAVRGIKLDNKDVVMRALDLYSQYKIDYPDCLGIAFLEYQQLKEIYSYDQDFDRVETITRLEPEMGS
ncbi:MAG: PIN domain-containing protein [Anaerolineae bacterium]|nr:PIN domain-containing protein [Anaerolineae bacterium]